MRGGIRLYFYPRPPRGGRPYKPAVPGSWNEISIHALREEGDLLSSSSTRAFTNFYPRPPRGGRPRGLSVRIPQFYFYPRPPRGGRRGMADTEIHWAIFLSTPSARRATGQQQARGISHGRFLSTPSARRATSGNATKKAKRYYFYPRPPRGGRRQGTVDIAQATPISIHALREEGDRRRTNSKTSWMQFLSTPSARRATLAKTLFTMGCQISIHALREEGDS